MGHFSNNAEADFYRQQWCECCTHSDKDARCPIMDLHWSHGGLPEWVWLLNLLIPRTANGDNGRCLEFKDWNELPEGASDGREKL